jgi:large subunit ribosomal protein L10e
MSFGKPIGTAARVSAGQKIIILRVAKEFGALAKTALHQATLKLPIPCRLVVEKGQELLQ